MLNQLWKIFLTAIWNFLLNFSHLLKIRCETFSVSKILFHEKYWWSELMNNHVTISNLTRSHALPWIAIFFRLCARNQPYHYCSINDQCKNCQIIPRSRLWFSDHFSLTRKLLSSTINWLDNFSKMIFMWKSCIDIEMINYQRKDCHRSSRSQLQFSDHFLLTRNLRKLLSSSMNWAFIYSFSSIYQYSSSTSKRRGKEREGILRFIWDFQAILYW